MRAVQTAYAFGLRRNETRMRVAVDFGRNTHGPEFGEYGVLYVRHGKAQKGSPPKAAQRSERLAMGGGDPATVGRGGEPAVRHDPAADRLHSGLLRRFTSETTHPAYAAMLEVVGKRGELASYRREEQELGMLCLHILQSALGLINTLIIQDTLFSSRPSV
ncbi:hypothetical protein [Nonomuraea sp. NPDC050643]|uniref:hypothetical protein n=1 Tax=Nonomuraea sp. NPDC050643 TaxID=3155660 RepID=UPI0033E4E7AD